MALGQNLNDVEYTVFEPNGSIKVVKNGQERYITREEYDRVHPKHSLVGCKECVFVPDQKSLFLHFVSRELKDQAGREPQFVSKFTMPGWSGHASFYIFRCRECETVVVDTPHGYHGEFMFLSCPDCRCSIDLNKRKYIEVYSRDGLFVPASLKSKKERSDRVSKDEGVGLEGLFRKLRNSVGTVAIVILILYLFIYVINRFG